MNAEPTLHVMTVIRTKRADGKYLYEFSLPDQQGSSYASGHTLSRFEMDQDFAEAATNERDRLSEQDKTQEDKVLESNSGVRFFTELGQQIYNNERRLPQDVRDFLFLSRDPLLIQTNDPEFPWELVSNPSLTGHERFLGIYRPIGRTLLERTANPEQPVFYQEDWLAAHNPAPWEKPHQSLGILTEQQLPGLHGAIGQFRNTMESHFTGTHTKIQEAAAVTPVALRAWLNESWEVFCYMGHAIYMDTESQESPLTGFRLGNDQTFGIADMQSATGSFGCVFLIACEGGHAAFISNPEDPTRQLEKLNREGLTTFFMRHGAQVIVSPLWPTFSEGAAEFAGELFRQTEQGVPFGEALRAIRLDMRIKSPTDPTWGTFVLYGDPRHTLATIHTPTSLGSKGIWKSAQPTQLKSRTAIENREQLEAAAMSRAQSLFCTVIPDPHIRLSSAAKQGLGNAILWLDETNHHFMTQVDLLVGLTKIPDGMLERGLRAVGSSPEAVYAQDMAMFPRGKYRNHQTTVSNSVKETFQHAVGRAIEAGRTEISEEDIVTFMLVHPLTPSMKDAFLALNLDPQELLNEARRTASPPLNPNT